jgi:TetR/AcrR family transcriptional regulator, tetracycline repressor protein
VTDQRERGDLSREEVVRTALRLVDAGGLSACTVRALADELAVTPMAIYWHVPGKEQLFDAILDAVLAEIPTSDLPAEPFEALAAGARRYRAVFARHPHVAALLAARPTPEGPAAIAIMDTTLRLLTQAGLTGTERTCAYLLIAHFVMAAVVTEHAGRPVDAMRAALGDDALPDPDTHFEFGLACLLGGLRAHPADSH